MLFLTTSRHVRVKQCQQDLPKRSTNGTFKTFCLVIKQPGLRIFLKMGFAEFTFFVPKLHLKNYLFLELIYCSPVFCFSKIFVFGKEVDKYKY